MKTIFEIHPELLTIDRDQKNLSPVAKKYLAQVKKKYPDLVKNLDHFAASFSQIKNFNLSAVQKLEKLPQWTYAATQQKLALETLQTIAKSWPIPTSFLKQVEAGLKLDLSQEPDVKRYYQKLDRYVAKIKKLPTPKPLSFDTSTIGKLPLVEINDPNLQGKISQLWTLDVTQNPGQSIKDVMALWMIETARKQHKIKRSIILVEGTSGNTGAGMAIVAKKFGLKIILAVPDKISQEKINRLRSLGAHVVITPTKVNAIDPKSYYAVRDYVTRITDGWQASQYDNPANSRAHEAVTGKQIWQQTQGQVTALVATAGTSGTISGIGKYLKKQNPNIKIIAVDTVGSILYLLKAGYTIEEVQQYAKGYTIQGFGEDIQPKNLDLKIVDQFLRISDATGLQMTRMLPMLGFVPGQSSGAAYAAVLEALDQQILTNQDKVVVIFPDTGVPYRHDVYNQTWLTQQQFNK